jgi:hypothetical protein
MKILRNTFLLLIVCACSLNAQNANSYQSLTALFKEWRTFENPPKYEQAPDYRKSTFESRQPKLLSLKLRLSSIDTTGWTIPQKVDYNIVLAEMNGYDFNLRVLKPWVRDPEYYKVIWTSRSDVPGHEGPTNHGILELWQYDFPLDQASRSKFLSELRIIPAFYEQAKENLTGNARDLWVTGIRGIQGQVNDIDQIFNLEGMDGDLMVIKALNEAKKASIDLITWLENESSTKTGPSGIGKENYTWYLQNVHLVPLTWEDEVMILKRELARAWSTLKFEEHRNRKLPQLKAADSPAAYDKMADEAAKSLMTFLEDEDIVTVKDYFDPALREHLGQFVPKETRNFFYITSHFDPRPLFSHFYHWFELARMDLEPNPSEIRQGALLYNIFDSRNEGMATAVEEMFMHAGLYDDSPRSREIVYIMIAQRAARGLGSLYAHANEMTMEEAGGIHSEYTPRGWMKTEKELLIFEQHLYLRQPGYGTSYITGKYLMELAMAEYARKLEAEQKKFTVKDFFDKINLIGNIPTSLGQWELTGEK